MRPVERKAAGSGRAILKSSGVANNWLSLEGSGAGRGCLIGRGFGLAAPIGKDLENVGLDAEERASDSVSALDP